MKGDMIFGKNKILLFRKYSGEAENIEVATMLVFQVDHTFTYSRSLDRIVTKSGTIVKVGGLESEVSIEAIQSKEDPTGDILKESVKKGYKLEMWEVNIDEDLKSVEGEYPAVYCQGYLDSWEIGASVEDESGVSSTFIVEKEPQEGFTGLAENQELAVQYAFRLATGDLPTP